MTEISSERIETVTIPSALRDIGWIPLLFSTIVGAPSILALLQMALEFDLTSSLRWIVQGYNALTEVMGRVFEPLILPVVRLVGTLLKIDLSLYPHWRPLFLMGMVVATSITRAALPTNDRLASFLLWMLMATGALIGAVVAGLAPPDSGAPAQLLFAASPFFGIVVAVASLQLIILMVGMLDRAEGQDSPTATPLSAILYVPCFIVRSCHRPRAFVGASLGAVDNISSSHRWHSAYPYPWSWCRGNVSDGSSLLDKYSSHLLRA